MLFTPGLWGYVALPFVLSLLGFAGAFALVLHYLGWGWAVAVPVLGVFLFLPIASLVASPFNEEIADAVEHRLTGVPSPPFALGRFLRDLGLGVTHGVRSFLRWLLLSAAVLAVSLLVPVVGTIVGLVGGFAIAVSFAAYDALDATLARRGWSYAQKRELMRQHRGACLGLGTVVAALLMVPIVNALALPFGAAGGAWLLSRARPGNSP